MVAAVAFVALVTACDTSVTEPPTEPLGARGVVVLDGYIQPGLTFVSDTGGATTRIPFGDPTSFDGGGFELFGDAAVAASSRGAGDLLYVATLSTGTARTVQMPAGSNPGTPRITPGSAGPLRVLVPLRDSQQIAIVRVPATGAPIIERIGDVGVCPVDAAEIDGVLWVLDANARCRTDYRALGDLRLIRVSGASRDTIVLPGLRGSTASMVRESASTVVVAAGGDADFSSFPYTLTASGAVARVNLSSRQVVATRAMPTGSFGATLRDGAPTGYYVTMFGDLVNFESRTVQLDGALMPTGPREGATDFLDLRSASGDPVRCDGMTGDELGRRFCYQVRTGAATFVLVLNAAGVVQQEFAAGQGGVALQLRF